MSEKETVETPMVSCRKCHCRPYTPSFERDFYVDDVDGPGTGLCERCLMAEAFKPKDAVPVDDNRRTSVCEGAGSSATCRFLTAGPGGFACAKGSDLHGYISGRVEAGTMKAVGDNCSGPPDFTPVTA